MAGGGGGGGGGCGDGTGAVSGTEASDVKDSDAGTRSGIEKEEFRS